MPKQSIVILSATPRTVENTNSPKQQSRSASATISTSATATGGIEKKRYSSAPTFSISNSTGFVLYRGAYHDINQVLPNTGEKSAAQNSNTAKKQVDQIKTAANKSVNAQQPGQSVSPSVPEFRLRSVQPLPLPGPFYDPNQFPPPLPRLFPNQTQYQHVPPVQPSGLNSIAPVATQKAPTKLRFNNQEFVPKSKQAPSVHSAISVPASIKNTEIGQKTASAQHSNKNASIIPSSPTSHTQFPTKCQPTQSAATDQLALPKPPSQQVMPDDQQIRNSQTGNWRLTSTSTIHGPKSVFEKNDMEKETEDSLKTYPIPTLEDQEGRYQAQFLKNLNARGGYNNVIRGMNNMGRGGYQNVARGGFITGRGGHDTATRGGYNNVARGGFDSVPRGDSNDTVRGGPNNMARGSYGNSTRGGFNETFRGGSNNVRGGHDNATRGGFSGTVRGGSNNVQGGHDNMTRGGYNNVAHGSYDNMPPGNNWQAQKRHKKGVAQSAALRDTHNPSGMSAQNNGDDEQRQGSNMANTSNALTAGNLASFGGANVPPPRQVYEPSLYCDSPLESPPKVAVNTSLLPRSDWGQTEHREAFVAEMQAREAEAREAGLPTGLPFQTGGEVPKVEQHPPTLQEELYMPLQKDCVNLQKYRNQAKNQKYLACSCKRCAPCDRTIFVDGFHGNPLRLLTTKVMNKIAQDFSQFGIVEDMVKHVKGFGLFMR